VIWRLPRSVTWFEKLNLTRNVLKKIGVYEIVRRFSSERQLVLIDEGTLQIAHNLFVHVSVTLNVADLYTFARLVPLPDLAIHVRQSEAVLIERTLKRGHKRIPNRSRGQVERFIRRAVNTFDELIQRLVREGRMSTVAPEGTMLKAPDDQSQLIVTLLLESLRLGHGSNGTDGGVETVDSPGPPDLYAAFNV
jgi:hypothetical protein